MKLSLPDADKRLMLVKPVTKLVQDAMLQLLVLQNMIEKYVLDITSATKLAQMAQEKKRDESKYIDALKEPNEMSGTLHASLLELATSLAPLFKKPRRKSLLSLFSNIKLEEQSQPAVIFKETRFIEEIARLLALLFEPNANTTLILIELRQQATDLHSIVSFAPQKKPL